ncbi:hypothetical protein FRC17_007793 [Serendipita sp. 399]|nr:hypothetical protein FRC17_007793 [Serendipita sp. 399]
MLQNPQKYARQEKIEVPDEFLSKKGLADKILKDQEMQRKANSTSVKGKIKADDSSESTSILRLRFKLQFLIRFGLRLKL